MNNPEIFNGIVMLLINNNSLNYTTLYEKLKTHLGRKLSHRDYSSHLTDMVNEKIIYKQSIEGKNLPKYYLLTKDAEKQFSLKILGIGTEYERRLSLYQLLLYFETFKRGEILDDKQLNRFMKRIGSSKAKLRKIDTFNFKQLPKIQAAYEDPVCEIEVLQLSPSTLEQSPTETAYYLLQRGFSIKEFVSYIEKVRNDKEPRPFSSLPAIVPFVHFINYDDTEIEEAIDLLEKAKILRQIVFSRNKKNNVFRIADKRLIKFTQQLRFIGRIHIHKIIMKVGFVDKPSDVEKSVVSYFFGQKRAGHVIAFLNDQREKNFRIYTRSKLRKNQQFIKNLCSLIDKLFADCLKQNEEIFKDEFLRKLCLPFTFTEEKT